ncbi:ATPase involved in DNA repair-like protein [Methylobacterium sp. 4-46]|uniref:AAA family ATPase n=1 Tax=unclassified Methylobacterium TaxID=2615210 RepID=UPI000165CB82|nr:MULTISPECIES: AAA family ATPase [Methylobacterium]ACA20554.1 ATPase involved in DNA repair-like protein [Methylobacterium sp. 4-46]WFT79721.1 AAA family ATPase [Methylobacterium nodulans]
MSPAEAAAALDRLGRALARAEARRAALTGERDGLVRAVAAAKGRLERRDAVDLCLRELQQETHQRSLARIETLLSAVVQEVLPGEKPVSLDLTTERGLPALDIGLLRPDGGREDVLEDNGGAMTNVVGMGLRLIAVVKAGLGRFIALDEADCWIAPARVPAFYRVLEDGAARLSLQCLAISHHDVTGFPPGTRVSRIGGDPARGVLIDGPAEECAAAWEPDAPGFRHIRLIDVQGFADAVLPLAPGVNALVGPNNRGKSTVIRALRAVFYGEARDGLVRAGKPACRIEIGVAGGRILRFVRQVRRSPVNLWSLHEPDGSLVRQDGATLETGGRDVPDWVDRLFGITRVEELEVHVAHQKFPVFLLGEKAPKRSAVLSLGREAGYIRAMQDLQRERVAEDQRAVREGERRLALLAELLAPLAGLEAAAASLAALREEAGRLAEGERRLAGIEAGLSALARLRAARDAASGRARALAALPGPEVPADLARGLAEARHREGVGERLLGLSRDLARARAQLAALAGLPAAPVPRASAAAEAHAAALARLAADLARARARAAALAALPEAAPALAAPEAALRGARRLAELGRQLAAARGRTAEARAGLAAIEAETAALLAATGGRCPACGGTAAPESLLDGHRHAGAAA